MTTYTIAGLLFSFILIYFFLGCGCTLALRTIYISEKEKYVNGEIKHQAWMMRKDSYKFTLVLFWIPCIQLIAVSFTLIAILYDLLVDLKKSTCETFCLIFKE